MKIRDLTLHLRARIFHAMPVGLALVITGCATAIPIRRSATDMPMPPRIYASQQTKPIYSPGYLGEIEAEYDTLKTVGFACNEWNDVNLDGLGDFPNEFAGIKNQFESGEKLTLIFLLSELGALGKPWTISIFSPDGKQIESKTDILTSENMMLQTSWEPADKLTTWLLSTGGPGKYRATWYVDKNFAGTCAFEIAGDPSVPLASSVREYTVRRGDSLSRIASRVGMSTAELIQINNISNPSMIRVGQVLRVIFKAQTYTVNKGDTLSQIAQQFDSTAKAIRQLNGLKSSKIFVGQQLLIPGE